MIDQKIRDSYEPTIGIECHVQLKTRTKLFSGANNDAREAQPNTTVSPICFGFPGTLPVLNQKAVDLAVRAGVALNADIALESSFDRKHYFYPDLPKGYQITQLERPIVGRGSVEVPLRDGSFTVRITRAHLEEDAGKLTHPEGADYSLVDLNRAGTPLIEIVSEADMHSAAEAKAFAQELYLLMTYAGVTDGDLYHGNMRFDVNISVAKKGADMWGTRVEVKNLNSFRSIERAVEYEFNRHVEALEKGGIITQETRGWDDAKQRTFSQRSKEQAQDYRYFPDADIPPVVLVPESIETVRAELTPQLPPAIRSRLHAKGLPFKDIATLLSYPVLLEWLLANEAAANDKEFKQMSDLLINVMPPELEKRAQNEEAVVAGRPEGLLQLVRLVAGGKISSSSAKVILAGHWTKLDDPEAIAQSRNLLQESDEGAIAAIVDEVLAEDASQKAIADIKAGNEKAIGYLVGQVMKRSQGKANPGLATRLIKERL